MAGAIELLLTQLPSSLGGGSFAAGLPGLLWESGLIAQITPVAEETPLISRILSQIVIVLGVVVGIGLVIFVHELGHFLAAKWCGVKVEKFYVGFDFPIRIGPIRLPRTLGRFRWGETEYGIGTIPLGGYVKMLGQEDDPRRIEEEAKRIRRQGEEGDADAAADQPVQLDPRSFPAKSVWQRMIIISAGVVMNVITGVMFAAAAFLYGVPYTPAAVRDVTAGGPAYQAGIEPGGEVVGIGHITYDEELHFNDMRTAIVMKGMNQPDGTVNVKIDYPDGLRTFELKTTATPGEPRFRQIGIAAALTNRFPSRRAGIATPGTVAAETLSDADAEAEVIAVNGEPIPAAGEVDNVAGSVMLQRQLHARPDQPVDLTLRRTDDSIVDVTIPPQPMRMPGIGFAVGPVRAVVADGVAEQAGVRVGDLLVAVNGREDLDAFALPGELAVGDEPVELVFERRESGEIRRVTVEMTPGPRRRAMSPINTLESIAAVDRFDFAYEALPRVSRLYPADESSAGETPDDGLQIGDDVKKVSVLWPGGKPPKSFADRVHPKVLQKLDGGWEFSDELPLALLVDFWQTFPEGTRLRVTAQRNSRIVEKTLSLYDTDVFRYDRGLEFVPLERVQVAAGLVSATSLGWAAGKRRLGEVFSFLGMLVTGRAKADLIGGPITIFRYAGHETSRGLPALLMFLTLLSMNLAILNFLPIPALDGGHMLFLTAEAVLGRPINEKLQMQLTMAGVLALLSLMAFAIFNDIRRLG